MPAAATKKPNQDYAAPELPANLDPASTHSYYMAMADWHDKQAWKNNRLGRLKPLWSSARNQHDDKHQFHRAMRDGFAQKALAVDLAAPMDGASGFQGMKESIEVIPAPIREGTFRHSSGVIQVGVSPTTHTYEEFVAKFGSSPMDLLRTGKIDRFTIVAEGKEVPPGTAAASARRWAQQTGELPPDKQFSGMRSLNQPRVKAPQSCWGCGDDWYRYNRERNTGLGRDAALIPMSKKSKYHGEGLCVDCYEEEGSPEHLTAGMDEAFGGVSPTGALPTINNNKTASARPLQTPFPTAAATGGGAPTKVKHMTTKPMEATEAVARGASPSDVLSILLGEAKPKSRTPSSDDLHHGAVCSECGNTMTTVEYSKGESNCCKADVIPAEDYK